MGTLDALCHFPLQAPLLSSLTLAVGDGGVWLDYLAQHFESSSARHMHTLSLEGEGTPPGWSLPVIPVTPGHPSAHGPRSACPFLLVKDHAGLTVTALERLVRVAPVLEHLGIAGIRGEALPQASLNATSMQGPQLHWLSPMRSLLRLHTLEWNYGTHRLYCYQCQGRMLSSTGGRSWAGRWPGPERASELKGTLVPCVPPNCADLQCIPQADMAAGWSGLRACAACDLTIVMPGEGFMGAGGASPIVAYGMGVVEKHLAWSVARGLPSLTFRRLFHMTQVAWQPDRR
ncbi:hypothetical protein K439DRAFT_1615437 [Ramaria rubella]|nr:hypothetical protein K439DRAFT_1615437 [Ramaria rubella]